MKGSISTLLLLLILIFSCKSNKKEGEENTDFFPALSFLKSQAANVDSSVFRIIKIVKTDSVADTTYLKREMFKEEAKDFLSIPDIASNKWKDDYTENKLYDADLEQVSLSYIPKKEGDITRQEVLIKPSTEGDKVMSIFINRTINSDDSTVQKIMYWQVDKRFRIVTISQKENAPEKIKTIEVIWNDFAPAP